MCGRYRFTLEGGGEIRRIAQIIERNYGSGAWMPGEIRPTDKAPVLTASNGNVRPGLQSWGYRLADSLAINARAETAAEKPLFRDSVVSRRCVVPSTGFWEWDGEKQKYLFTLPGETALYMAGLYAVQDGTPRYCILTAEANASMRGVHSRMPLVLRREQVSVWLRSPEAAFRLLRSVPPELEKTPESAQLRLW